MHPSSSDVKGETYIRQPYQLYSAENQTIWQKLYWGITPEWERFACREFLDGIRPLRLGRQCIPRLAEVNPYLKRLAGFCPKLVAGCMPAHLLFDSLSRRDCPTTITIRGQEKFDYSPEPGIFHDVAGRVPIHADKEFAECLGRISRFAKTAVESELEIRHPERRLEVFANRLKAVARFFWFTAEFGLLKEQTGYRVYGSGLLSSLGELRHSV